MGTAAVGVNQRVSVMVMVMIVMMVPESGFAAESQPEGKQPHRDDQETGKDAHPGEETFRKDVLRGEEGDQPEGQNTGSVGDRHGQSEKHRVFRCATRPDKIGTDDSLAVTG